METGIDNDTQRLRRIFAALNATNEAILRSKTPAELYPRICAAACQGGDFSTAAVLVPDVHGTHVDAVAVSSDHDDPLKDARIGIDPALPEGRGLVAAAFGGGRPCVTHDFLADSRLGHWHALARRNGVASAATIPVVRSGAVCAVLAFYSRTPAAFDDETVSWLVRIAENVAFALDRFDTEASLHASEARVRSLLDLTTDWMWETDAALRIVSFGGRADAVTERLRAASVGKHMLEHPLLSGDSPELDALRALVEARSAIRDFEHSYRDDSGVLHAFRVSGRPEHDRDGRFAGYRGTVRDITPRKRAERLRELEHTVTRRLTDATGPRKVLQALMQVICESELWEFGGYFKYEDAAGASRLITGWRGPGASDSATDYYAKHLGDVIPAGGLLSRVKRSGKPLLVSDVTKAEGSQWLDRVAATGQRTNLLFPVCVAGEVIGAFGFGCSVMREPDDALLQTVRVISDQVGQFLQRKENEQAVRESEARFRALTQLSSDWYWETDELHRITRLEGRRLDSADGWAYADMIGKSPWEAGFSVVGPGVSDEYRDSVAARLPMRGIVVGRRNEAGAECFVSVSAEPMVDDKGRFTGYRGVTSDITARLRIEAELRRHRDHLQELVDEQTASLRRAMQVAEAANRAKSEFLSNMSHELRTPMHAILSFANLGRTRASAGSLTSDKAAQFFDRVDQSATRLLHLLTELLEYAKLDAGKTLYAMAHNDLAQIAPTVAAEFEVLAAAKNVRIEVQVQPFCIVWCDAPRIGQVVRNILSNAIKWTPPGGAVFVSVVAPPDASAQTRTAGADNAILAVRDTGPGIPVGELDLIFEEFVQSSRTKTGAGGTGLGLAIARRIVSDHGGRIWAENAPEGGAVFYCSLPKHAAAAGASSADPSSAATVERTVDLRADFH